MKTRLLELVETLRHAGLRIATSETLDALRAIAVVGVDPEQFREAIAACVVKDAADRAVYDDVFDRFFAVPTGETNKRRRQRPAADGDRRGVPNEPDQTGRPRRDRPRANRSTATARPQAEEDTQAAKQRRLARLSALQDAPLKELSPDQIEDCHLLVAHLADRLRKRASRRLMKRSTGRLDIRRTIRRSMSSGGVPLHPILRERRPGKVDLVALCDLSHSVAVASRFFLALLGPAPAFFRRARFFGYVDTPFEIWLQDGHLVHDASIDLHARSDFGNVLRLFCEHEAQFVTRNTVLLALGDARNNRRPARADLWKHLCQGARRCVWLNPEKEERWDSADSAMSAYRPQCDELFAASTLRQLCRAIERLAR